MRLVLLLVALITFSAYTLTVWFAHGPLGFVPLALREPWAMQLSLDLCIMVALFAVWMWRDARAHGINVWPFLLLLPLGSPCPLLYLLIRELKLRQR